ncbi:hypothetical protein [Janibacter melonis]|uniref:hypothetical protein n=1 Tax=Janibacter melonis TaxID=262209 RepID=UPI002094E378|nr:hypothetical protein [Janibacter melonis]
MADGHDDPSAPGTPPHDPLAAPARLRPPSGPRRAPAAAAPQAGLAAQPTRWARWRGYGPPSGPGGYMSAPPPTGGYRTSQLEPVEAIKYGWAAFTRNPVPYLLVTLLTLVLTGLFNVLGTYLDGGFDLEASGNGANAAWSLQPFGILFSMVGSIIASIISLGMLRMSFDVLDGRKAELGRMFSGYNVGIGILTGIVVSLLTSVGFLFCILPGFVVGFFLLFASSRVVDSGAGVGDALSGSFRLVKDNAGPIFLWVLLLVLLVIASVCTCGIALFVTVPIFSISTAYVYRVITGGQVAQPV